MWGTFKSKRLGISLWEKCKIKEMPCSCEKHHEDIVLDKYKCPKHGEVETALILTLNKKEYYFCFECWVNSLKEQIGTIEKI